MASQLSVDELETYCKESNLSHCFSSKQILEKCKPKSSLSLCRQLLRCAATFSTHVHYSHADFPPSTNLACTAANALTNGIGLHCSHEQV